MDLNRAMVEMYKKRQSANKKRQMVPGKRPKVEIENDVKLAKGQSNSDQPEQPIVSLFYEPKTSLQDLYGCDSVKDRVILTVNKFLRAIKCLSKKSRWPKLVCGSSGIGKTSFVEAATNYAKLKLVPIFLKKLVEQSRVEFKITLRQIEAHIRQNQPAVVLVDDLDMIKDKDELKDILRNLVERLSEDESVNVLVFCTSLDASTTCGIRFSDTFQLKRPDLEARKRILEVSRENDQNLNNLVNESLSTLAIETSSFSPLDLKLMLDLADELAPDGFPNLSHCRQAIDRVKQSFKRGTHLIGEKPSITWNNIGGLSEVRKEFEEILEQLKEGNINCKFAGVALHGPPGCGKTMVAQAMANEAGLNFIAIKPSELVNKYLGETEKNIRRVFSEAREYEPCMIYFDEFDGLCGTRGHGDNLTSAIHTLLSEMDGFTGRGQSIVLVSTNRLQDIDPAILRAGRLSNLVYVGPPGESSRRDILQVITKRLSIVLATDVNLDLWAKRTENFTGADLHFLVSQAERKASAQLRDAPNRSRNQPKLLTSEHFECAWEKIQSRKEALGKKGKVKLVT